MLSVRHVLFTPLYAAHILSQPYRTFYRHFFSIVVAASAVIGACWVIQWLWPVSTWLQLCVSGLTVSALYTGIVYLLLSPQERLALKGAILESRKPAAPPAESP